MSDPRGDFDLLAGAFSGLHALGVEFASRRSKLQALSQLRPLSPEEEHELALFGAWRARLDVSLRHLDSVLRRLAPEVGEALPVIRDSSSSPRARGVAHGTSARRASSSEHHEEAHRDETRQPAPRPGVSTIAVRGEHHGL